MSKKPNNALVGPKLGYALFASYSLIVRAKIDNDCQ